MEWLIAALVPLHFIFKRALIFEKLFFALAYGLAIFQFNNRIAILGLIFFLISEYILSRSVIEKEKKRNFLGVFLTIATFVIYFIYKGPSVGVIHLVDDVDEKYLSLVVIIFFILMNRLLEKKWKY